MASRAMKIDQKKSDVNDTNIRVPPDAIETVNANQVADRAYDLWQERGCPVGSPETDWLRAEEELRNQTQRTVA
jgi:hypothetical protein